jgi:hypothetical protein
VISLLYFISDESSSNIVLITKILLFPLFVKRLYYAYGIYV